MNHHPVPLACLAGLTLGIATAAVSGQPCGTLEWVNRSTPPSMLRSEMVYDTFRQEIVMLAGENGGDPLFPATWIWRDGRWQIATREGPRVESASLAYDSQRRRAILFGTENSVARTWEWDGTEWTVVAQTGPSRREGQAMAYDEVNHVVVLFGGSPQPQSFSRETWTWDGGAWTMVSNTGPAGRTAHAMTFDASRGRVILNGGRTSPSNTFGDTWSWNGTAWEQESVTSPGDRTDHSMTYDTVRNRAVLCAGFDFGFVLDTWELGAKDWMRASPSTPPGGRASAALAFYPHERRSLFYGGHEFDAATYAWDGASWTFAHAAPPFGRYLIRMVFDSQRGKLVTHGGHGGDFILGDTLEFDGDEWVGVPTTGGPGERYSYGMAYDPVRQRTVLFGGRLNNFLADTWEWDGAGWTQRNVSGPSVRAEPAMFFDEVGQRVILFGGQAPGFGGLGDTWAWDGSAWTQLQIPGPSARFGSATAFHSASGRGFLFGGGLISVYLSDTWSWDGAGWSQLSPPVNPPGRQKAGMSYDSDRQKLVLYGGESSGAQDLGDMWEWDGEAWSLSSVESPPAREGHAMAYMPTQSETVLFGGRDSIMHVGETWTLGGRRLPIILGTMPDRIACPGSSAAFRVETATPDSVTYQWRKDAKPIKGANAAFLVVESVDADDHGAYDVVVSNECGEKISNAALLAFCPADINCDEHANSQDFFDFLNLFFTGDPAADFNASGGVDSQDFFDFLAAFFTGCGA